MHATIFARDSADLGSLPETAEKTHPNSASAVEERRFSAA